MVSLSVDISEAVDVVWNYHQMNDKLEKADMIWALGSHDLRVADRVADLWHLGLAPVVVMSGGLGNFTEGVFEKSEAELFAERAIGLGVPERAILIEGKSTNTGENVNFTRDLLRENQLDIRSAIAVQKPYMERRTYATIAKQWPEISVVVSSPQLSFEEYCNAEISAESVINIMVGDLQRIIEYPKLGYMVEQEVPQDVLAALNILIDNGYTRHTLGA